RITHTPLRLNAGRFSAFDLTPRSMYRLFMERMAANGIREARISEEWNELEGWTWKTQVSRDVGINPVPNIIYSVSPKHTDEYFAQRTRDAASLKVNRLCLKDPGGLLTPERVKPWCRSCFKTPTASKSSCTRTVLPVSGPCVAWRRSSWASRSSTRLCHHSPTVRRTRRCSTSPGISAPSVTTL